MPKLETKSHADTVFKSTNRSEEIAKNDGMVSEISKALEAGYGITPDTQVDGAAYRLESLDPTLNITTFGENDFTIYKDLERVPVNQTVQKYTVYYNHGRTGHQLFQPEIAKLSVNTPNARQKTVNVKFVVDTKGASFAMQWANTTVDTQTLLEISGVNTIAKAIEYATFYGDSDLATQDGEGYEFDGISKLMDQDNVVDLHGGALTPGKLNEAATIIGKRGYGKATDAYMPVGVKADFINQHLGSQRILQPNPADHGMQVGFDITRFISANGDINLHGSTIMDLDLVLDTESTPDVNAGAAPTVQAKQVAGQGGAFLTDDKKDEKGQVILSKEVGTELQYRVVAVGAHDSLPSDIAKATPTAATDGVTLTITLSPLVTDLPHYVAIYRKSDVPGDEYFRLIDRVPMSKFQNGTLTYTDVNDTIPGTADVFILDRRPENIRYLEFAPIMKFPLAVTTTATNFAMLWYGALQVIYPKRIVKLHNVLYASDAESLFDLA